MYTANIIARLTNFIVSIAEALLGLRIVLKLFAANASAPFVRWIYETTTPLLEPFKGMFPSPTLQGGSVLEFSALFALVAYALAGYLLIEFIASIEAGEKTRRGKKN